MGLPITFQAFVCLTEQYVVVVPLSLVAKGAAPLSFATTDDGCSLHLQQVAILLFFLCGGSEFYVQYYLHVCSDLQAQTDQQ